MLCSQDRPAVADEVEDSRPAVMVRKRILKMAPGDDEDLVGKPVGGAEGGDAELAVRPDSEFFKQNSNSRVRVGLFGGTFNPIHRGHTQVAKDVLQKYRLTSICFLPSALPPHKTRGDLATVEDRYEMTRIALADEPAFKVSDVEIQRSGPSYTVDTLKYFRNHGPGGPELFFIVGLDAFLEIHTWDRFEQLFDLAAFIVMARPQVRKAAASWQMSVAEFVRERINAGYKLCEKAESLIHLQKRPIYLAMVTPMPISSSRIRAMIRQGLSVRRWVDPAVAAYIEGKGLYR